MDQAIYESLFRAAFEKSAKDLALVDSNGRFLLANPAFCRKVGYTLTELQEMTCRVDDLPHTMQTAVYRIAQAADQTTSLEALYPNIHDIIKTVMPADNFYLALYDDPTNLINFTYYVDENPASATISSRPPSGGITEYILKYGKSQLIDAARRKQLLAAGEVKQIGPQSVIFLGVPLKVDGRTIGVMAVQHYQNPSAYGPREQEMLEYVAARVAQVIDRKQKDATLRDSEARFRLLAESFHESLVIYNRETRQTIYANPPTYNIFGVDVDEYRTWDVNETLRTHIHPDDRAPLREAAKQAAAARASGNRNVIEVEFRIILPSGEIRWLHQRSYPVPASATPSPLIYMIFSDITQRKEAEIALRRSEAKMQSLARLANKLEQARNYADIVRPLQEEIAAILNYQNTSIYLFDEDQQHMRLLAISGERSASLANNAPIIPVAGDAMLQEIATATHPVIIEDARTDPRTNKEIVSRLGGCTLVNIPIILEKQRVGIIITGTLVDEGVRTPTPADIDYLEAVSRHIAVVINRIQFLLEREETAQALQNSNNQLQTVLARLKDTQEKMVQRERLAAVGQLAAGMAHDFNNILAVIVLYTQMALRLSDLPAPLEERLRTILSQSWRATDLVQQILDFSRSAVLEPRPMDLVPFLKEQVKLLMRTLPESIQLSFTHEAGVFVLNADPTRMQQVIVNLVVNARDAMPNGGKLAISLAQVESGNDLVCTVCQQPIVGKWLRLQFVDSGFGIPDDQLSRIFEPFFTTKDVGKGTGLGLSQVSGIVDQHGGHMTVASVVGQGTTFRLYLPVPEVATKEVREPDTAVLLTGAGETILIVEDDTVTRTTLAQTIEMLNYQAVTAVNGREALAILTEPNSNIALVLSDMIMPILGGQALLTAMRQQGFTQPVIILTGHPLENDLHLLQDEGLTGWLLKPPNLTKLAQLIAQALHPPLP